MAGKRVRRGWFSGLRAQADDGFLNGILDQKTINTPVWFYDALTSSALLRAEVSRRIDFAVFVDPGNHPAEGLRAALDPQLSWACSSAEGYAVCAKQQRNEEVQTFWTASLPRGIRYNKDLPKQVSTRIRAQ